jgi:nitroreductase/Pyruvate/2-oxoacid:ferredoxin oxidoreductase delta subunit
MALLEINKETCTKCGACAATCAAGIIYFREGSYPRLLPGADEICLRCGHCMAICHTASIIHREIPEEQCPPIKKTLSISFENCAQLIKSRRSIREFKEKAVPREEIERIIEVARYAPTGHNNQEVQWLVINDPDKMRQLSAIGADWMRRTAKNAPGMREMIMRMNKQLDAGHDFFLRNAPALVTAFAEKNNPIAATDCAIALGYFDLAAVTAGLGCCWAGLFYFAASSFKAMVEAIALPKGYAPYGALMVGYPKYIYTRIPARRPARIIYRP